MPAPSLSPDEKAAPSAIRTDGHRVVQAPDGVGGPDAVPATSAIRPEDITACLSVLAQAVATDPDDPAWQAVHEAAARLHRAAKKQRKAARRTSRGDRDRSLLSTSTRFHNEDPAPDHTGQGPRAVRDAAVADASGSGSGSSGTARSGRDAAVLGRARRCYICKDRYDRVDPDYHLLCPLCAEENRRHRNARCDLRGRTALVTGGRIKIGFHLALKLLRDGAEVVVTTRFPRDAARRYAAVADAPRWLHRLHVHGADLLDLGDLAGLLAAAHDRFDHLDILVNNAAQTIRRPSAYHREVRAAEGSPLLGTASGVHVTGGKPPGLRPLGAAGLVGPAARISPAASPSSAPALSTSAAAIEAMFPAGRTDETGQPLDLRHRNSWSLRLHEVDPAEWLEVHLLNAFAPFMLTSRLRGLLEASPWPDRYVVQVSAMEGSFSRRNKTVRHPHTNMAKAALNMLTHTSAADYAVSGIHMTSVDTGWVTDERPHPEKAAQREAGFRPPLDVIDGAARIYHPVVSGVGRGERLSGLFLKDYRPVDW